MGIVAVLTETKILKIFSMYLDEDGYSEDAETFISNPLTVDLLESSVDFPLIVIGNEKGQCVNYMVIQTEKELKLQPVEDTKFNVSSKILFMKSIPAMSLNEIVKNTISPLQGSGDNNLSPKSEGKNLKIHDKLYVVITSNIIKVFKNKFSDSYGNIKLDYEPVFSDVVEINGSKYCICIMVNENLDFYLNLYTIPSLDLVRVIKFPTKDLASIESLSITPTGLMIVWFKGNEFKQYFIWGKDVDTEEENESRDTLDDIVSPYSAKSFYWSVDYDEELSYTIPKSRRTSIREIDSFLKKNLDINTQSTIISPISVESLKSAQSEEKIHFGFKPMRLINSRILSKSDSHCDNVRIVKTRSRPSIELENDIKENENVFAQTKENIEERGERLDELNNQVSELNRGASEFLQSVREYNQRMSKKKWYQL